jgi:type 1 glutamine amidotransferase
MNIAKFLLLFSGAALLQAADPIRVMILDGQSGGPYHDWRRVTAALNKQLDETGLFHVEVITSPEWGGDFRGFRPDFAKYQAVVLNYDAPDWPSALKESFESYVRNGGGVVSVHAADNAFPNWPAFNQMIGIGGWRGRNEQSGPQWYVKDGRLVADHTAGAAGSHGARLPFQVTAREPEHPILKGLPKVWLHTGDELYANLRGPGENMTVLATAHSRLDNNGTGREEPMLMVLSYGRGRIFHTTLGHDIPALSCVGFITTFQRGTEWAATGKVTQAVPAAFPSADKELSRADIAAMAR